MQTTITLQLPSNPLSIMQWKSDLQSMIENNHSLFLINGSNDIATQSELVLMGRDLNTNTLITLTNLLIKQSVSKAQLNHLSQVEGVDLVRLSLDKTKDELQEVIKQFATDTGCDFALVAKLPDFSKPGLVLMDMDSTTIQIECIDEIARLYGVGDQVSAVTAAAMRGELDFNESLRTRVGKLANAPESVIKEVADNMPLMPGLLALIAGLKAANWKVAIASGGFTYFANRLKEDHGFDVAYANTLEIVDNTLTGQVIGEIVNADVKARTLNELAEQFDIPMSQTAAIGDGANDLVMMAASSLGIAIHAKPIVQEKASVALNHLDLEGALGLLQASLPLA
ncbi:phosphoserine phosphatase SerB [Psychromonas sp. GE-S-Ul-11]|uniref:phosphoserine phosphatase SerB n=1 Tax=Psychromonas sp. GE-S-Ul-11 TaxID=3241170 RepID=UPI00390C56D4